MDPEAITLTGEQETLLIPLYAKATAEGILDDPKAADIIGRVDYDFAELRQPWITRITLAMRARRLDEWVREHPAPLVLHLGCGLDARVDRVGVPTGSRWYDLDLTEVVDLRRRFFQEDETVRMIGASVTDLTWLDRVEGDGPATIVAEGLLMYLEADEVRSLLVALHERFPGSTIAFDAFTRFVVRRMARHPSLRKTGARVHWGIDDPSEITEWAPDIEFLGEWTFGDRSALAGVGGPRRWLLRAAFGLRAARRAHRVLFYRL